MFHPVKTSCRALLLSACILSGANLVSAQTTLRIVPSADLQILDPMGSTADIVKMHGFMIYDTLYSLDEHFVPQPQMVEHMELSDDRKTWRFTLREGLKWHDGQPVLAQDCVASLKRWQARDAAGQLMARQLKEMRTVDARTFELEFNEPYGLVLESLSKVASNVPFMMPQSVAETDPFKPISDYTGSGPYKFASDQWIPGSKVVYEKFADYLPRQEPASGFAGGKIARFDVIEWHVIRDQQTALSALISGEIDFWQNPSLDLLPIIEAAGNLNTKVINETGTQGLLFFNHTQPPFDSTSARQAMFYLTNQTTYLQAVNGHPEYYRPCASFFICGTPMETTAGLEALHRPDPLKAKALFEQSGWDFSRPIVILDPTDESIVHPETVVTAQLLRDVGLNVDVQTMDWATVLNRRNSKDTTDRGGWNLVHSYVGGQVVSNPVWSITFSAACEQGIFGWPCDSELEDLRLKFALAEDQEMRKTIAAEYTMRAFETGHHVPLGQWSTFVVFSDKISDVLVTQDVPVFWNLKKSN